MNVRALFLALALALAAAPPPAGAQAAQGTGFTFQGVLQQSGVPLNGTPNLEFRVFDSTLAPIGPILTKPSWPVSAGQLTVDLDFGGGIFNGQARYLQITVNGTVLTPLMPISSTPYAIAAQTTIPNSVNGSSVVDASIGTADIDASIQRRVTATCTGGNAIRAIDAAGAVTCEPVGDMSGVLTPAPGGLTGGNTSGSVNLSIANLGITSGMISLGAIGTSQIQDGAVSAVDINSAEVQRRVSTSCTAGNAIRTIGALGEVTCEPVGGGGGSGDITAVNTVPAGGLQGGTTVGDANLSIQPGGVTAAMIADATVTAADLAPNSVAAEEINPNDVQRRVTGTCAPGSAIRGIGQVGDVACEPTGGGGGSGDITAVNTPLAGGLAGGSLSGDANLVIQAGGITSAMVADGALTAADLGTNSVGSDEIQVNAVQGAQIVDGSVVGLDIANGTITSTDVNTASVQARVAGNCTAGNAIRVIDAAGNVTCEPVSGGGGSGDITSVNTGAGSGLTGGAASGDANLAIAAGGVTSAMVADSSLTANDLATNSVGFDEIQTNAVSGLQILDGSVQGSDIATGTITSADVNTASVQARVASSCPGGSAIRVVNSDGTVACEFDNAGTGWDLTGNVGTTPATNFIGTADDAALRIQGGTVGVNTPVPLTSLHVRAGDVSVTNGTPYSGTIINAERAAGDAMISIIGGAGQQRGLIFGESGNTLEAGIFYDYLNTSQMDFRTAGNTIRMQLGVADIDGAGGFGPGTSLRMRAVEGGSGYMLMRGTGASSKLMFGFEGSPSILDMNPTYSAFGGTLYVEGSMQVGVGNVEVLSGNGFKPGGGAWAAVSDARLKRNVEPLETALDRLLELRGVSFEYLPNDSPLRPAGKHNGFIAQEVQKVFPEWVGEGKDGYLFVAPTGFEALTVEALRDLKAEKDVELEALRSDNEALRAELAELRGELNAIRASLRSVSHRN